MRYEVVISAVDLYLTPAQARNLLEDIESVYDLDGIRIYTGFEYDSLIENEGSDSEDFYTEIKFYVDEELETSISLAGEVMDEIKMKYKEIPENGLFFTIIDVDNIEHYS
ncbi:hypothetical protein [Flavobacterium sp.]|uniref:hypothetical protein n=1 Tax=Flavobacterium sp. TaxID=239 RepID=UPI00248A8EF3|nr:hypothetical protein [Flavobacterium sp.]MDI1317907.1 hypothetical protein [Flavobacterium sp.]